MVNINKIVNVDFEVVKPSSPIGSYSTVVYVVENPFQSSVAGGVKVNTLTIGSNTYYYALCKSYKDVESINLSDDSDPAAHKVRSSAYNFFENGGAQLLIVYIQASSISTATDFDDLMNALHMLDEGNDFLYVCVASDLQTSLGKDKMSGIVSAAEKSVSPYTYRILLTAHSVSDATNSESASLFVALDDYSVGIQLCTKECVSVSSTDVDTYIDAALLIGAYYSRVDLNGSETIKDYCYTPETLSCPGNASITHDIKSGVENVSSKDYDKLIKNNINFIDQVGSSIVNFGGNLKNGVSIHTDFGACAAENDITNAVLNAMLKKQYLTASGMNTIITVINNVLARYKTNGYLETNSLYTGETVTRNYNGATYTVIKKNTSLSQGYYVFSVPIANISDADREARKFPPIIVVMQTAFGARVVEITGTVR